MKKFNVRLASLALCSLLAAPQPARPVALTTKNMSAAAAVVSAAVGLHGWYQCRQITAQLKKELKWDAATPAERKDIEKIINQKTKSARYRRNGGLAVAGILGLGSLYASRASGARGQQVVAIDESMARRKMIQQTDALLGNQDVTDFIAAAQPLIDHRRVSSHWDNSAAPAAPQLTLDRLVRFEELVALPAPLAAAVPDSGPGAAQVVVIGEPYGAPLVEVEARLATIEACYADPAARAKLDQRIGTLRSLQEALSGSTLPGGYRDASLSAANGEINRQNRDLQHRIGAQIAEYELIGCSRRDFVPTDGMLRSFEDCSLMLRADQLAANCAAVAVRGQDALREAQDTFARLNEPQSTQNLWTLRRAVGDSARDLERVREQLAYSVTIQKSYLKRMLNSEAFRRQAGELDVQLAEVATLQQRVALVDAQIRAKITQLEETASSSADRGLQPVRCGAAAGLSSQGAHRSYPSRQGNRIGFGAAAAGGSSGLDSD